MFFEVKAKCGHVGKNKYIIKNFYIKTDNAKKAAFIIRNTPRVKHDHKDAIRQVRKITYEEYIEGVIQNKNDLYFHIHNSSVQKRILSNDIEDEERQSKEKIRDVRYKLKKWKIIDTETKKMIAGDFYG